MCDVLEKNLTYIPITVQNTSLYTKAHLWVHLHKMPQLNPQCEMALDKIAKSYTGTLIKNSLAL